jgi:hypothetical protein
MRAKLAVGLLLTAAGLFLVFSPELVASALNRPYESAGEKINVRATWGGLLTGIGLLVTWLPAVRPHRRFALAMIMWAMIGIAFGRLVGFVLDGSPDTMQWVWLVAEIAIAAGCAAGLKRLPAPTSSET